jgi:hypothetical protein
MTYKINKAQWADKGHTCLLLDADALDDEGKVTESFTYVSRENDPAPVNQILWAMAMEDESAILEDEATRIITGEIPLPEGKTIRGENVCDDATEAANVRRAVNDRLAPLLTPTAIARAEVDETYAAERKAKMLALLAIEEQPGFPYDIDWPGTESP